MNDYDVGCDNNVIELSNAICILIVNITRYSLFKIIIIDTQGHGKIVYTHHGNIHITNARGNVGALSLTFEINA